MPMLKVFYKSLRCQLSWVCLLAGLIGNSYADELPLTHNVPMEHFQNRQENVTEYNFDASLQDMFRTIETAEGFEEELEFRRQIEIVPANPTNEFRSDAEPVFSPFSYINTSSLSTLLVFVIRKRSEGRIHKQSSLGIRCTSRRRTRAAISNCFPL